MTDQSLLDLLGALVKETSRMATAAEAIASVIAPAPNLTRPMSDWPKAAEILESIGATVTASDKDGPTRAEYQGRIYVRRSAHDEDGEKSDAIWFNCVIGGNVKDGNVKYARLLAFRDRSVDKLANGAKKLKVPAPVAASQPAPGSTTATSDGRRQPSPETSVRSTPSAAAIPARTPTACTCTKEDGLHEWNCAIEVARRAAAPVSELDAHFGPNPRAQAQKPAPTPGAARTAFYAIASKAMSAHKITAPEINELVKAANGDGFVAALALLEKKIGPQPAQ
jgi:hypothetical protein